jgi:dCMP deaminase
MIINAGLKKIYYKDGYADQMSTEMLSEAGIEVIRFNRNHRGRD